MSVIRTPEELLRALGDFLLSNDPIADLTKAGYTLSPALREPLEAAVRANKLAPVPSGAVPLEVKKNLSFQSHVPLTPPPAAPGTYDVVLGLTLALANDAVNAVYQSGTIPHQVALDQLLSPTDLAALEGFFRVDKPGGHISRLKITAAPTLSAIADGSSVIALDMPIEIDWIQHRTIAGRQIQQFITKAVGVLRLTGRLVANIVSRPETSSSTMTFAVQLLTDVASPAESPRLTLNADSPVQLATPYPPSQVDGTALLIQDVLASKFTSQLSWALSPEFNLQIGMLDVSQADVITSGGVLVAGVCVAETQSRGNPSTLQSLLPDSTSNIFLQLQDTVPNAVLQQALNSGALTAAAKQQYDNAVVDSATASFQNNAFVIQVNGRLVDECPVNVDLAFIQTRTITLKFQGSSIEIDEKDDNSIAVASNWLCLVTTVGLVGLAAIAGAIYGGFTLALGSGLIAFLVSNVGPFLVSNIFGGGGSNQPTLLQLTSPIPGSDFLATINGGVIQTSGHSMLLAATAGLQIDNINTVLYVRFLVPDGIQLGANKPLVGAKVELMDQDVPRPTGDDVVVTIPRDTVTVIGETVKSTRYKYEPPTSDDKLAEGQTDLDGTVRFALLKDQLLTGAGDVKVTVSTTTPTSSTSGFAKLPVDEASPDLYFRVTLPDGTVTDTRHLPSGFFLNFQSSRVGTLASPLTFNFGTTVVRRLDAATGS